MDLKNKKILITGASGFLGKQIVEDVIKYNGVPVLTTTNKLKLKDKFTELEIIELDLQSNQSIDNLINYLTINNITIDGIVCNASNRNFITSNETKEIEYYHQFFNVDVIGHMNLIKKIVENNISNSISIVMMSSIYGVVAVDDSIYPSGMKSAPIEYSISKSSIKGLVKNFSVKYGIYGTRINSIISGGIENNQNSTFIQNYSNKTTLKRMAKPFEISNVVCFLLSDMSSYITGTELVVDGGFTTY